MSLTTPMVPSNNHSQMSPVTTPDTAQGARMIVRTMPRPRKDSLSTSAMPRPSRNCGTTDPTTQITEAWSALQNVGSAKTRA